MAATAALAVTAGLTGIGAVENSAVAATATSVTVTVDKASAGRVGTGFVGFSYEKDEVGLGLFDAHNTRLVNLFRLLGHGVLRIGGNTNDSVTWNQHGRGGSINQVAPTDVTKLTGFLKATGWQAIYGINLKTNNRGRAAAEAKFAAGALGDHLLAFEIGNEPNFYEKTESRYESAFDSYAKAIRAAVPKAVFAGPGAYDNNAWLAPFAAHEHKSGLVVLSMHTYIGNATQATIKGMLASTSGSKFREQEAAMRRAVAADHVPQWRFTEVNSYFDGGRSGVSNVAAAALWSLDLMDGVAANSGGGVNFHGNTTNPPYTPIVYSGLTPKSVQGVYYGELLWTMAGTGTLHTATVHGAEGVAAYGIGRNVLIDNESSRSIALTVGLVASAGTVHEYLLAAPSLSSTKVTIGGSSVSADGTFRPKAVSLHANGTKVRLTIPAGSVALLVS